MLWLARLWRNWTHVVHGAAGAGVGALCGAVAGLPWFALWVPAAFGAIGCYLYGWEGAKARPLPPSDLDRWLAEPWPTENEPVDACEHKTAPAVPVETDVTGDNEPEVVGWLCFECGAKVSTRAAFRRNNPEPDFPSRHDPAHINRLRKALAEVQKDMAQQVDRWQTRDGENFVISTAEHDEYKRSIEEAKRIRDVLNEAERRAAAMRAAGVQCSGWTEVSGHAPGSVVRRYAVPGECLCGGCYDVVEVRSHQSDTPVRTILGGTINTPDVSITPFGLRRR